MPFVDFNRTVTWRDDGKLLLQRTSLISGKRTSRVLDVTREQWDAYLNGTLIQDAFPALNDNDREFILSGITPEEWDDTFSDTED